MVTEVINAGHFWAQEVSEKSRLISQKLSDEITRLTDLVPLHCPAVDKYCLAIFPPDGLYYRGKVVEADRATKSATVHYLDYGNVEELSFDQIYDIPIDLLSHPLLCVECFLAKVKPSFKESSEGVWSDSANRFFSNLVSQRVCVFYQYSTYVIQYIC